MKDIDEFFNELSSDDIVRKCYATTFASSFEDGSGRVAVALLTLLEGEMDLATGQSNEYSLCIGRAAVSLIDAIGKLPKQMQLELGPRVLHVLTFYTKSDDSEIRCHAAQSLIRLIT